MIEPAEILARWRIRVSLDESIGIKGLLYDLQYRRKRAAVAINPKLTLKERVVTLIHEILHIDTERDPHQCSNVGAPMSFTESLKAFVIKHPEYRYEELATNCFKLSSVIEKTIEEEAYATYDREKKLVGYIIEKYRLGQRVDSNS